MTAYVGYIPANTTLYAGDYLTSPSGVWYAAVGPSPSSPSTSYNFNAYPGSSPTISPGAGVWLLQPAANPNANLGGFYLSMQGDGNLVLYTSATGQIAGQTLPIAASNTAYNLPHFATLGDNGNLDVIPGLNPQNVYGTSNYTADINTPVTAIELKSITYDFNAATLSGVTGVAKGTAKLFNKTEQPMQGQAVLNLSYTRTDSFSFAVSNTVGVTVSSSVSVGVPGLATGSLTVGITDSTTITKGQTKSTSTQVQFSVGFRPELPPLSEYEVTVTGQQASYAVPYTWEGVASYDGPLGPMTAPVVGTGVFNGASQGNFSATVSCVIAAPPTVCDPQAPFSIPLTPVPEAGSASLLAFGLLATMASQQWRRRRRRRIRA